MAAERSIEAFADTAAFRAWLAEHHATSPGIWLKIGKKNSGLATTTHDEALEAALAYGWIDGQARPGDETYWLQGFTRRTSRSPWSKRNCDNAERLIAAGHMEPAGQAEVDRAKADGRWARAYDGQRDIQEPADLRGGPRREPARRRLLRDAQPHRTGTRSCTGSRTRSAPRRAPAGSPGSSRCSPAARRSTADRAG